MTAGMEGAKFSIAHGKTMCKENYGRTSEEYLCQQKYVRRRLR